MHVLIIGGTRFLGRHLVDALRERGHVVTLFNSGHHPGNAPPEVEQIHGSRERDLERLGKRRWDAAIDTCGYVPSQIETSTRYLGNRAGRYVFVSSISALDLTQSQADETTSTLALPEGASRTEMTGETYGPLKALCEHVVASAYGDGALVVRPGLLAGPYDPTDRFTYWPVRIARAGTVLAPVGPDYFVQFIDARDLALWIVLQVEHNTAGTFNVTGPPRTIRLGDVLAESARVANTHPSIAWADEAFLKSQGAGEWIDLPLWISDQAQLPGMHNVQIAQAKRTGLTIRPLQETIRDTLRWAQSRPGTHEWKAGLTPEREAQILAQLA